MQNDERKIQINESTPNGIYRLAFGDCCEMLGAVWQRRGHANLRAMIDEAAREFEDKTQARALYCYMHKMPKGVEEFSQHGTVTLMVMDCLPQGVIFVYGLMQ